MSAAADDRTVREYERKAADAENAPMLTLLKIGRGIVWVFYALVLVTAILLSVAFLLGLAGANPTSGFVQWVYRSTERAMMPFRGIFPTHDVSGASVLDLSYLFAAIVYFIVALLIDALHRWLTARLRRQQWAAEQARYEAETVAGQVATRQQAADVAAQQAAAREYAARQSALQQYELARAAAQEVLAQQQPAPAPASPPGTQPSANR